MIKNNHLLIFILFVISLQSYAGPLSATKRVDADIHIMYLEKNGASLLNSPFYTGKAKQESKTIQQMVVSRYNSHVSEIKFINAKASAGLGANWVYSIALFNNFTGWTQLETDLNEQAYITNYYQGNEQLAAPKLLNSRNEIIQGKANEYWIESQSNTQNLVQSDFNPTTNLPVAIHNKVDCFTIQ
ncbi:hypothetical protein [Pseudoalteromonas luteoviolacea]|nr:hypothetical protein [Pseudoalteromonas luteoviolacea]